MTPEWVTIAVLGPPRGNRGEVTAVSLSSRPQRFSQLRTVRLFGSGEAYEIESAWDHQGTLIFKFRGVDTISEAQKLRGAEVRIPGTERAQLEAGEFYHSDLIGCEVRDRNSGRMLGRVIGVDEYGGPALLAIDKGSLLIPFVSAICVDIRPAERIIFVELPEGLETLDRDE